MLFEISQLFVKLAYYPADQENFQKIKQILELTFKLNSAHLQFIIDVLNSINILEELDFEDLPEFSTLLRLNSLIKINANLKDSWSKLIPNEVGFFYISFISINNIEETESAIQTLISEFSKIQIFFNSFTPTINHIDPEYVDIDSYIISYLEFFVKLIEEYEDIFSLAVDKTSLYVQIPVNKLKETKDILNESISQLQERTQEFEESPEDTYKELELGEYDEDDPEYKELLEEFREKQKLREEGKDPEDTTYESYG